MKHPRLLVTVLSAVWLVAVAQLASAQTDQINERSTYSIEWDLTPAEFPCLTETIRLTGTVDVRLHVLFFPTGGYSYQWQEHTKNVTAVGLTTGMTYQYNGPLSYVDNGWTDDPWNDWYSLEWTFHNINHFEGPGQLPNLYLRTRGHATVDQTTGEPIVEFWIDDVLCK